MSASTFFYMITPLLFVVLGAVGLYLTGLNPPRQDMRKTATSSAVVEEASEDHQFDGLLNADLYRMATTPVSEYRPEIGRRIFEDQSSPFPKEGSLREFGGRTLTRWMTADGRVLLSSNDVNASSTEVLWSSPTGRSFVALTPEEVSAFETHGSNHAPTGDKHHEVEQKA